MFQKAIVEMDTDLLTRIKDCVNAQYARVPRGTEGVKLYLLQVNHLYKCLIGPRGMKELFVCMS